jgi:hypothetical protein
VTIELKEQACSWQEQVKSTEGKRGNKKLKTDGSRSHSENWKEERWKHTHLHCEGLAVPTKDVAGWVVGIGPGMLRSSTFSVLELLQEAAV